MQSADEILQKFAGGEILFRTRLQASVLELKTHVRCLELIKTLALVHVLVLAGRRPFHGGLALA